MSLKKRKGRAQGCVAAMKIGHMPSAYVCSECRHMWDMSMRVVYGAVTRTHRWALTRSTMTCVVRSDLPSICWKMPRALGI